MSCTVHSGKTNTGEASFTEQPLGRHSMPVKHCVQVTRRTCVGAFVNRGPLSYVSMDHATTLLDALINLFAVCSNNNGLFTMVAIPQG